jgi:hypothetical protein
MADWTVKTPIVFVIFKRLDTAERVFEVIRQARPSKLFVIADGPRQKHSEEVEKCAAVRALIERVDWDCQVLKNYSDVNLGCRERFFSGLGWVFDQVEEAIILEDDILTDITFFRFCDELLERYRHNSRVMSISATNYHVLAKRGNHSYSFSHFNSGWGWATWRRAWRHADAEIRLWPEIRDQDWLIDILDDRQAAQFWVKVFQSCVDGKYRRGWDYQWRFACWIQGGLCIHPNVNLVRNIGFGSDATNTRDSNDPRAKIAIETVEFPLRHPEFVIRDTRRDKDIHWHLATPPSLLGRARRKISRMIKSVAQKANA